MKSTAKQSSKEASEPSATAEHLRLAEDTRHERTWKRWGPYLSERQWGTVREDHSPYGNAWEYLSHDAARSRAYRWGEDGIAGISDDQQRLCLAVALWNGRDPILKERLFGLTNSEGNHGEDVKELYYYLDATPTHSYLKMLYKYPQREFPYAWLVEENRRRGKDQPEFELMDTGIFDDDRYFDVFVEYAMVAPDEILMRITVHNRGPEEATIHVLPQLWFRSTWTWSGSASKPQLQVEADGSIAARHPDLGTYRLYTDGQPTLLFTDNETNAPRISMPDKWEYPWYAAWDLAFHCIPLALVDAEFAKAQLVLLTCEWYMHPNGQLPAYEWAFGDVNPPVHAWATWRVFQIERKQRGDAGDLGFLERVFHKLMLNFTWWVNRKDTEGRNIFQGGFLGLANIGVFDRSAALPTGGYINQSDGTSWMAMYSLNLRIALELAQHNPVYESIATKFFEHFLCIAEAMSNIAGEGIGLWDDQDNFFYDVLNLPDGERIPLRLRSMVGLIPLFAVETLDPDLLDKVPEFRGRLEWYLNYRPDLAKLVSRWQDPGHGERRLLSLLRGHRMKCLFTRMLDESEFLSDYGIRALSRAHRDNPYVLSHNGQSFGVNYQPAESTSGLFGGNSNWRGPIWFPVNYLLIESLQKFHYYYGDDFKVECPTGSGKFMTINEVADELSRRLTRLFLPDASGRRPVLQQHEKLATDPHFRDYILFHEYFDGDSGRGVGASHQTGWTGLVAKLLQPRQAAQ